MPAGGTLAGRRANKKGAAKPLEDGHPSSDEEMVEVEVDGDDPEDDSTQPRQAMRRQNSAAKKVNFEESKTMDLSGMEDAVDVLFAKDSPPFVDRVFFCSLVAIEVTANLVVLALEADFKCYHHCKESDFFIWWVLDQVFTILPILDVAISIINLGPSRFLQGDPGAKGAIDGIDSFRYLDVSLVVLRCIDVWALPNVGIKDSGLKLVSAFRVMHLGRFVKNVKSIKAFRELWLIMEGLQDTMKCVAFVTGLLVLVLWVFAVLITMMVGKVDGNEFDFKARNSAWSKDDYWGSVPKSMFSLFQVLTRDRWSHSLVRPLVEHNPASVIVFLVFLVIGLLAMLSTVVGVVIESTLASAKANEDKIGQEKQKLEAMVMKSLEDIFREADTDASGDLSRGELASALEKPHVTKRMKILEIAIGDLDVLFSLLDNEGTGIIKTGNFFRGCTRLRGPAMARDLNHMAVDLVRHVTWVDGSQAKVDTLNESLATLLDLLDFVDRDVVQDSESDAKDPVMQSRRNRVRVKRADYLCKASRRTSQQVVEERPSKSKSKESAASRRSANSSKVAVQQRMEYMFSDGKQPPPPPLPEHLLALER